MYLNCGAIRSSMCVALWGLGQQSHPRQPKTLEWTAVPDALDPIFVAANEVLSHLECAGLCVPNSRAWVCAYCGGCRLLGMGVTNMFQSATHAMKPARATKFAGPLGVREMLCACIPGCTKWSVCHECVHHDAMPPPFDHCHIGPFL